MRVMPAAASATPSGAPRTASANDLSAPPVGVMRRLTSLNPERRRARSASDSGCPSRSTMKRPPPVSSSFKGTPHSSAWRFMGLRSAQWMNSAPASKGAPRLVSVNARPPMRGRASSTMTLCPAALICLAAASPAAPAPTTTMSTSVVDAHTRRIKATDATPATMPRLVRVLVV